MPREEEVVVIVGAGQSGLATAASLAKLSIPSLILERDDCVGSLWRNRCYDRVSLHLAKRYCELPHLHHRPDTPEFMHKSHFIRYLDDYADRFRLRIRFRREVVAAEYDEAAGRWHVSSRDVESGGAVEEYAARFLVVASGENDEEVVPEIAGLGGFSGPVVHSSRFGTGLVYEGKEVLVVGSGNSGMEVAHDLAESGAHTSIVVRSQLHVVSKEIWFMAMLLMNFFPLPFLDAFILFFCYLKFGDLSKYGLHRPDIGPFSMKKYTTMYPVVDVGTVQKIKSGKIQVMPCIKSIRGNWVTFSNGDYKQFDAIILATGYRSTVKKWLKSDDGDLIGEDGLAKQKFPSHWKGRNGLYCAGLARRGIYGSAEDALNIASDIASQCHLDPNSTAAI